MRTMRPILLTRGSGPTRPSPQFHAHTAIALQIADSRTTVPVQVAYSGRATYACSLSVVATPHLVTAKATPTPSVTIKTARVDRVIFTAPE